MRGHPSALRLLAVTLCLALLTACGGSPESAAVASPTTAGQTPTQAVSATSAASPTPVNTSTTAPTATTAATATTAPTATEAPTATPEETPTPLATATTEVSTELGDEEVSNEGGYAFRKPVDWDVTGFGTFAAMVPKGAGQDSTTTIIVEGGSGGFFSITDTTSVSTSEEYFDALLATTQEDDEAPTVSNRKQVTIGGEEGWQADLSGTSDDKEVKGRIAATFLGEGRSFVMIATASPDEWDASIGPLFDAVLGSVRLFEPEVQPTPEDATTPTPAPTQATGPGSSRATPAALGSELRFPTWSVTVTEVLRGEEANQAIADANEYNEPPAEGSEYVLVSLRMVNISSEDKAQSVSFALRLMATGDSLVAYDSVYATVAQPLEGELFPGGVAEGQVAFMVPSDEQNLMLLMDESYSFNEGSQRFVALDSGASIAADPSLGDLEPTDIGAQRSAPAKIGETVRTTGWEATVLEMKRGEEAATLIEEAESFNDPAPEGQEYILVKIRARYLGKDNPDVPETMDYSFLKIVGARSRVYDAESDTPPAPKLQARLFPGGETEGWTIIPVSEGEQGLILIFQPFFSFDDEDQRFIALE